jgi:hypothetical protein
MCVFGPVEADEAEGLPAMPIITGNAQSKRDDEQHKPELITRCVNAHDRCFGGAGAPCPYCEPVEPLRTADGRFFSFDADDDKD